MNYSKPQFEVGNIIRDHRQLVEDAGYLNAHKKRVFTNLSNCRTEKLGYHKDICDNTDCQHQHYSYNSCRDRHCPKCNGMKREKWISDREEDLLPVRYFHTVFTLPQQLNDLFVLHPVKLHNLLFSSVWETIRDFGFDYKHLGAQTGMTCILHTWGQNIAFHPHVHCIIPGGGLSNNGTWKSTKRDGKFLYPIKALSNVFRGKFCDGLIALHQKGSIKLEQSFDPKRKYLHPFYKNKWIVFAKLPMFNSKQVLQYIGRYTHRIAISNHRIKSFDDGEITFSWLDYRTSKIGDMKLSTQEFLRRFSMHILPPGFMKIRHYGILSSRNKKEALKAIRDFFNVVKPLSKKGILWKELFELKIGYSADLCPKCKIGTMRRVQSFMPKIRGSPKIKMLPNHNFYKN